MNLSSLLKEARKDYELSAHDQESSFRSSAFRVARAAKERGEIATGNVAFLADRLCEMHEKSPEAVPAPVETPSVPEVEPKVADAQKQMEAAGLSGFSVVRDSRDARDTMVSGEHPDFPGTSIVCYPFRAPAVWVCRGCHSSLDEAMSELPAYNAEKARIADAEATRKAEHDRLEEEKRVFHAEMEAGIADGSLSRHYDGCRSAYYVFDLDGNAVAKAYPERRSEGSSKDAWTVGTRFHEDASSIVGWHYSQIPPKEGGSQ